MEEWLVVRSGIAPYLVLGLVNAGEHLAVAGIFVPGMTLVVTAGFLAGQGVLDPGGAFASALVGAIVGDAITWWFGEAGLRWHRLDRYRERALNVLSIYHTKKGFTALLFYTFPAGVRNLVPFSAGLSGVALRKWLWVSSSSLCMFVGFSFWSGFIAARISGSVVSAIAVVSTASAATVLPAGALVTYLYVRAGRITPGDSSVGPNS
jgi:membrane protein DedA with SNARE-associated domain